MNNRTKVRAAVRAEIFRVYNDVFERFHNSMQSSNHYKYHLTADGQKIIELFRTKIGYSSKTYDKDILCSAYLNWRRGKESKKSMYNSRKDEK